VTNAVGVQPFLAEIWNIGASQAETLGENVADSEAGERLAAVIQKHPRFRPQIQGALITERSQHRGCLRPQRAVALLSPFAK